VERLLGALPVVASLLLVLVAATTACSASKTTSTASPTAAAASVFTEALAKARTADPAVSDAQLMALEKAAKTGEMSYEEVRALLEDTFTCFESAGVLYVRTSDSEQLPGFKVPTYSFGEPVAAADACQSNWSEFAYAAYQSQPKVAELRDAALEAERPQVLACIRAHGGAIEDNATHDEMRQAEIALFGAANKAGTDYQYCSRNYR
jgi:hypothetical protein